MVFPTKSRRPELEGSQTQEPLEVKVVSEKYDGLDRTRSL